MSSAALVLVVGLMFMVSVVAGILMLWYWRTHQDDDGDGGDDDPPPVDDNPPPVAGGGGGAGGAGVMAPRAGAAAPVPLPSGALIARIENALTVNIRPGMGAGAQHALSKKYGAPFPLRADGCVVRFEIKFGPPFEFGCKGKVGGIHVGPGASSGGDYSPNGASHRLMWDKGGGAFSYVYIPSGSAGRQPPGLRNPGNYGQNVFRRDFAGVFRVGQWYIVEIGVKLNTVGRNDGALMLSIAGRRRQLNGVVWRLTNLPIQFFSFNIFHGGPCKATQNSTMNIRNVNVFRW